MRITTRGRYALRAIIALARLSQEGEAVSITRLSEEEGISSVFLEQIFFKLRKAGLVESVRGPGGGFRFSKPLEEITIREILDAAGENLELTPCTQKKQGICPNLNDCKAYEIWAEATRRVNDYFSSITLGSLFSSDERLSTPLQGTPEEKVLG